MRVLIGNISYGIGVGIIYLARFISLLRNFLFGTVVMAIIGGVGMATLISFFMLLARITPNPEQIYMTQPEHITWVLGHTRWYWELLVLVIGSLTMWKGFMNMIPSID